MHSRIGNDRVKTEIAGCLFELERKRIMKEIESSVGHGFGAGTQIVQDLSQRASVRIGLLVMGNDLECPDCVLGHLPSSVVARGFDTRLATEEDLPDYGTARAQQREFGVVFRLPDPSDQRQATWRASGLDSGRLQEVSTCVA